jgi:hypothetical protein
LQVSVKVKAKDEAKAAKWGVGKHKVDKLEYKQWELEDLHRQIREEERNPKILVRAPPQTVLFLSQGVQLFLSGAAMRSKLRYMFGARAVSAWSDSLEFCAGSARRVDSLLNTAVRRTLTSFAESRSRAAQDSSAAFVTARTRLTQSVATTGLMSFNEGLWNASVAPAPNDVLWQNLARRGWERSLRNTLGWAIFVTIIIMFVPVVALLQQVINLQGYAKDGNWAQTILDLPVAGRALLLVPFTAVCNTAAHALCRTLQIALRALRARESGSCRLLQSACGILSLGAACVAVTSVRRTVRMIAAQGACWPHCQRRAAHARSPACHACSAHQGRATDARVDHLPRARAHHPQARREEGRELAVELRHRLPRARLSLSSSASVPAVLHAACSRPLSPLQASCLCRQLCAHHCAATAGPAVPTN